MKASPSARSAGFTLIELLVVIGIIGLLAAALLPRVLEAKGEANVAADAANLRWHYQNLLSYKNRGAGSTWPKDGGCKFVLTPWVKGVCEHTLENFDRYFIPGQTQEDPRYGQLRPQVTSDPNSIWQSFDDIDSEDTHYAGRAAEYYRGMWSGNEALMSDDNEFGMAFPGQMNVLMANGAVRALRKVEGGELEQYWDESDPNFWIEVGKDSPVPVLQKLAK